MKLQHCFLVTLLVVASLVQAQDGVLHLMTSNKYYLQKQISCVLDQGPCNVIGREMKKLLPEVLNNNCRRCTPQQREYGEILMAFMQQNHPIELQSIIQYYTPQQYRNY